MTAIGDILKILRHAKKVSSSKPKEKDKEKSDIKEQLTATATSKEVKKENPASKERKDKPQEDREPNSRRILSSRLGPPSISSKEDEGSSKSPSVFRRLGSQPQSEEDTSPNKNIFARLGPDSERRESGETSCSEERDTPARDSPQVARVSSTSSDGVSPGTPGKGES